MNVTSSLGGASASAWSARAAGPPDNAQRAQFMFKRADADGSGGVDSGELQTVLDKISEKTGTDLGKAADRFAAMDTDGDGSLRSAELDSGIKRLMPEPSSTMAFAQRMGGQGMAPAPPAGGSDDAGGGGSTSTDPLDTDGDGVVSAQERMAADMAQLLQKAVKAGDTDGDGSLSSTEAASLSQQVGSALDRMLTAAKASSGSTSTGSGNSDGGSSQQGSGDDAVKQLAQMLLRQYAQPPQPPRQAPSLNVAA